MVAQEVVRRGFPSLLSSSRMSEFNGEGACYIIDIIKWLFRVICSLMNFSPTDSPSFVVVHKTSFKYGTDPLAEEVNRLGIKSKAFPRGTS